MRLEPIDKPRGLQMRLAYWLSRRRLGKAITPLRVFYARSPKLATLGWSISRWVEKGHCLPPGLALLVQTRVAGQNGCGFCVDIARALAVQQHVGLEKFDAVSAWETSPLFDERERAALAYADEVTRDCAASDETFEGLRKRFDEREIVDLTALCAIESYFNRMNGPLQIESDGLCSIAQARR